MTLDPVYLLKGYATGCAAMFGGAALYINVAEHPARMTLDVVSARKQWVESFNRARYLQVCIAYYDSCKSLDVCHCHHNYDHYSCIWTFNEFIIIISEQNKRKLVVFKLPWCNKCKRQKVRPGYFC